MLCHLYTAIKYTTEKKTTTTKRIRRDHQNGKIHALFPWEKNIRLNFEIADSRLNGSHAFSRGKLTAKFRRELVCYPDQRLANF